MLKNIWEKFLLLTMQNMFLTVITLIYPGPEGAPAAAFEQDGRYILIARGECKGHISTEERGTGGFGYDSIFIPEGKRRTFAELPQKYKNEFGHRGLALKKLREML